MQSSRRTHHLRRWLHALAAVLCIVPGLATARTIVAVATNFIDTARTLVAAFPATEGSELTLVSGSTGVLYAQIVNGAPFDVLLSADQLRPEMLVSAGLALPDSRFTYAIGRLVLWRPDSKPIDAETLRRGEFRRIALANPELAPYGAAARDTLKSLGLWEVLERKIVLGENIGQTHTLIASGNAELGFIAASPPARIASGSRWPVPESLHSPIRQDAVLLTRAEPDATAQAFIRWLRGETARAIIIRDGYGVD